MQILPPVSIEARRLLPSKWDLLAAVLVLGFIVLLADASRAVIQPLSTLSQAPISLAPSALPGYALRTGLRMLIALGFSLVFTFTYATWAAKSQRAGTLLVPLLDILQSIPILGFLSVTLVFFLSLAPGRILGAEFAAIFVIFTSQAWNMAFSFYQSLAHRPGRADGGGPRVRAERLGALLADRSPVRHAAAHLEHDDVDVRRLVLRRGLPRPSPSATPSITLPGIGSYIADGYRRAKHEGHLLGHPGHACCHLDLRPAPVSPAGRLGRPFPHR